MKLSKHSIERMKERANIKNQKIRENFFRNALRKGLSINQIKDEKIQNILKKRIKYNSQIKVYKGYVFIYSKNSHQLYTLYRMEEL